MCVRMFSFRNRSPLYKVMSRKFSSFVAGFICEFDHVVDWVYCFHILICLSFLYISAPGHR